MTVLSPWRALERNDLTVTHWHGDVTLGGPFPSRFYHGGADLLSGTVRFLVTLDPGTEQEIIATPALSSESDEEISWTYTWSGIGVDASGTVTVHETGMVTCSVTLDPVGTKTFASIKLEIPLNPAICVFLRDGDTVGSASITTPVPTWDDGAYHFSAGDTATWKRFVSVANDTLGMQWCFESDANHVSPEIRIEQASGLATIHLLTENTTTSASFGYEFTLSPLPCRPLIFNWNLLTRFGRRQNNTPERHLVEPLASDAEVEITFHGSLDPNCDLEAFEQTLCERRETGLRLLGYTSSQYWVNDEDNDYDSAWTNNNYLSENHLGGPGFNIYKRCGNSDADPKPYQKVKFWLEDFQEFFLGRVDREFDPEVDHFDGLYLDVHNTQHSELFTDDLAQAGKKQLPYALHRDWCKAIYGRCENSGRLLAIHPQHLFNARCHAYAHLIVVGEELYARAPLGASFPCLADYLPSGPTPNQNIRYRYYMNTLPIRYWRSVASSRVTGVAAVLIPEHRSPDSAVRFPTENLLAMCRLHGVGFWHSFSDEDVVGDLYDEEAAFGLSANSRFYGYWQSNCPATTEDPDAKVSVYREGNRLLVYVVNFADEDRTISFQVPGATEAPTMRFSGTGLGDGYRGTPTETPYEGHADGSDGEYTVEVARENFASVEIELSATAAPLAAYHLRRQRCCR